MTGVPDCYNSYILSQVKYLKKKSANDQRVGNPFVTISRQTGAYGITVSKGLCEYLQKHERREKCLWALFDKDLIKKIAEEHDLPETVLPYLSEETVSEIQSIIEETIGLHPPHDLLVNQTGKTILHLAQLGYVILVGRGANIITSKLPGGFNIRLVSPLDKRIEHVQEYYQLTKKEAVVFIDKEDRHRKIYVKKYFDKDIDDPLLYDLIINVDNFGSQGTIELIGDLILNHHTHH